MAALAGCRTGRPSGHDMAPFDLTARRSVAEQSFELAVLIKPTQPTDFADALVYAPIIVRQATEGVVPVASVYFGESTAELLGATYRQWVYSWHEESGRDPSSAAYWLRITVDDAGFPLVWETLDAGCARVEIYVSQALADRAEARWGPTNELTRFAIEHAVPGPTCCAVIRVLSDGPVPMGPFVYVGANQRIATVICRCMPSQVNQVAATTEYGLVGAEAPAGGEVSPFEDAAYLPQSLRNSCPLTAQLADPAFLEKALRWPGGI